MPEIQNLFHGDSEQFFSQPSAEAFLHKTVTEQRQRCAGGEADGSSQKSIRGIAAEIKYLSVQEGDRIIMHQIQREADVPQLCEYGWHFQVQAHNEEAQYNDQGRNAPQKRSAEAQNVYHGFGNQETEKTQGSDGQTEGQTNTGQLFGGISVPNESANVVCQYPENKFQHDRVSVEGQGSKVYGQQPGQRYQKHEKNAAYKASVFMADVESRKEKEIEKNLTIYGPAYTHQRLQNSFADIEGNKQKAFEQKYGICFTLGEHTRKEQEQDIGSQSHGIIKRQDANQPFGKKMLCTSVGGKHNHKAADTKKDIHAESAAA